MFMLRGRAVARLLEIRNDLTSRGAGAAAPNPTLAAVEHLLFDLRAGRINDFVLPVDNPIHVFVTDA
ncbi:hypothetical protein [Paraburkholderia flava]|uniref:hypothetical protein n=1 Tax=Paraburkholderia flava TaxID=2547393 RepID=UPI00105D3A2C|nr:hypothetical protein [Paraburkholderia flava]